MSRSRRRRRGQHFLRDVAALEEIAAVADLGHAAGALEIGAGEGALTAFLVQSGRPVVALESDERWIRPLRERLGARARVAHGDALHDDLDALLPEPDEAGRKPVVVGNLPYAAASAIYRRLLAMGDRLERMVLMVQREVAHRIVAGPGSRAYGLLSVWTTLAARAWVLRELPPKAFRPPPKVHSATILVEPRREPLVEPPLGADEAEALQHLLGELFKSRRKTLANALDDPELIERAGLDPDARPETLGPETLVELLRASRADRGDEPASG